MALEIERKFLLKQIPNRAPDKHYEIKQYYCEDKKSERNFRLRHITWWENEGKTKKEQYIETVKRRIKPGVYEENETELSISEFQTRMKYAKSYLIKSRYIYIVSKKLKWEIDIFSEMRLVLAEIEIPKMNYKIKIPDYIKDVLIMEVTKFDEFTNKALASSIKKMYQKYGN